MRKCQFGTKLKLLPVLEEVILEVLNTPIGVGKVKKTLMN